VTGDEPSLSAEEARTQRRGQDILDEFSEVQEKWGQEQVEVSDEGDLAEPGTASEGWPENPMDLPEYQRSAESAQGARDSLPEARGQKTVARTEGGDVFESGWTDSPGFEGKPGQTERVGVEGAEAGHETDPHVFDPKGTEGGYESSHAERQAAVASPDDPVGVSRDICAACQSWFKARAVSRGIPQFVADPAGTHVFMPDGRQIVIPR